MKLKSKILFFIPVIVIIMSLFYVITMYINGNRIISNYISISDTCFYIANINTKIYNEMYDILIKKTTPTEYDYLGWGLQESEASTAIKHDIAFIKSSMKYISYYKTEKEYEIFKGISFRLNEILDDYMAKKESGYLENSELKDIISYYNNLSNNLIEIVKSFEPINSDKNKQIINDCINIISLAQNIGIEMGNSVIMAYTKDFADNYNDFTSAISRQNEYIPLVQKMLEEYENGFVFDAFDEANNSFYLKELREYIYNSYNAQSQNNNQQIDFLYFINSYGDITLRLDTLYESVNTHRLSTIYGTYTLNPYEKFVKALFIILIAYIIFLIVFAIRNRKKSAVKTAVTLNDDNFIKK